MSDMMTFPDTWEEFEKLYGFNDAEEIYTNNSRLIPSFRVKQWLDHLPSVQPEFSNNSKELEKNSKELDNKNGELISRQEAVAEIEEWIIAFRVNGHKESAADAFLIRDGIIQLPSVPRKGKWIDYSDEGYVECPFCHSATNCEDNKDELHYCFSCGAELR